MVSGGGGAFCPFSGCKVVALSGRAVTGATVYVLISYSGGYFQNCVEPWNSRRSAGTARLGPVISDKLRVASFATFQPPSAGTAVNRLPNRRRGAQGGPHNVCTVAY